jgi:hypothetical protein
MKKYSVREFADLMGWQPESVRQMCRQHTDKRTGAKSELPPGWRAEKILRDWCIHEVPLSKRERLEATAQRLAAESTEEESEPGPSLPDDPTDYAPDENHLAACAQDIFDHWFLEAAVHRMVPGPRWTRTGATNRFVDVFDDNQAKETANKRGRLPEALKNGSTLLQRLKQCYQYAVLNDATVSVTVNFDRSGSWTVAQVRPDDPLLVNAVQYDSKFDLGYWLSEIAKRHNARSRPFKRTGRFVTCLNCGRPIQGRKRDSLFCGDGKIHSESKKLGLKPESEASCRTQHGDWIKEVCRLTPNELAKRIVKRFADACRKANPGGSSQK